jgi:hypothetical protein
MYRKLAISGVSILAVMTLVVSAQQPVVIQSQPSDTLPPLPPQPGQVWEGSISYRRGAQGEEIELTQKTQELVKQLAKAEGEKKDRIKEQLTDTLGKQFDARQKRHQNEIAVLEKQLKRLRDLVDKRQENRREIVSKRLDQLVREADGLGW